MRTILTFFILLLTMNIHASNTALYVHVQLDNFKATIYDRKYRIIKSYPIATGKNGFETPQGHFKIISNLSNFYYDNPFTKKVERLIGKDNPLGPRFIGFHRKFIYGGTVSYGFHGTKDESSIGTKASNGCLRMFNEDVIDFADNYAIIGLDVYITK